MLSLSLLFVLLPYVAVDAQGPIQTPNPPIIGPPTILPSPIPLPTASDPSLTFTTDSLGIVYTVTPTDPNAPQPTVSLPGPFPLPSNSTSLDASSTSFTTTTPDAPTPTSTPSPSDSSTDSLPAPSQPVPPPVSDAKHSSSGAIAGGVVGGLVALGIAASILYLCLRRRRAIDKRMSRSYAFGESGAGFPPSPRLKGPSWLGTVTGSPRTRAQRLGSQGGDESLKASPPSSPDGEQLDGVASLGGNGGGNGGGVGGVYNGSRSRATSRSRTRSDESAAEFIPSGPYLSSKSVAAALTGAGAANMGRRASNSRTSLGDEYGRPRASYDLSVFTSNASRTNVATPNGPTPIYDSHRSGRSSFETAAPGPNDSTTSVSNAAGAGAQPGRIARKPAPKYESVELMSPVSPSSPTHANSKRSSSKPPVSGMPSGSRIRTSSNSSSPSSPTSPSAGYPLTRQESNGTLGGAFKFAGEKEGPVHYLIPDLPPPSAE